MWQRRGRGADHAPLQTAGHLSVTEEGACHAYRRWLSTPTRNQSPVSGARHDLERHCPAPQQEPPSPVSESVSEVGEGRVVCAERAIAISGPARRGPLTTSARSVRKAVHPAEDGRTSAGRRARRRRLSRAGSSSSELPSRQEGRSADGRADPTLSRRLSVSRRSCQAGWSRRAPPIPAEGQAAQTGGRQRAPAQDAAVAAAPAATLCSLGTCLLYTSPSPRDS